MHRYFACRPCTLICRSFESYKWVRTLVYRFSFFGAGRVGAAGMSPLPRRNSISLYGQIRGRSVDLAMRDPQGWWPRACAAVDSAFGHRGRFFLRSPQAGPSPERATAQRGCAEPTAGAQKDAPGFRPGQISGFCRSQTSSWIGRRPGHAIVTAPRSAMLIFAPAQSRRSRWPQLRVPLPIRSHSPPAFRWQETRLATWVTEKGRCSRLPIASRPSASAL
jgi:hypothetical protein